MTKRQIELQSRVLLRHVVDGKGQLEPKLVLAVAKAVSGSKWSHKAMLLRQFIKEVSAIERKQRAVVCSAVALSADEQQKIMSLLHHKHPQVTSVDWQRQPDLLAGVTAQVGDTWYDLSIQQRLLQVQEHLG